MPDFPPPFDESRLISIGTDTSASSGTSVTAGNSNAKGSWTQLTSSLAFDTAWVAITAGIGTATFQFLVDIGIGAAASEYSVVSNILCASANANLGEVRTLVMPLALPAGQRISTRAQTNAVSGTRTLRVHLIAAAESLAGISGYQLSETWGADTSDSGGTSVDPGATINTKGAWTQLTASSTIDAKWLCVQHGHNAANVGAHTWWLLDIGVGASSSEFVVIPDVHPFMNSADYFSSGFLCLPCAIPAGSRVSARLACNVNTATERLLDVSVIAFG